jgi:hypothetical protein
VLALADPARLYSTAAAAFERAEPRPLPPRAPPPVPGVARFGALFFRDLWASDDRSAAWAALRLAPLPRDARGGGAPEVRVPREEEEEERRRRRRLEGDGASGSRQKTIPRATTQKERRRRPPMPRSTRALCSSTSARRARCSCKKQKKNERTNE